MNDIQAKLIQAAKLLLEARALAKANVEEMRKGEALNKPLERRIDDVVYCLQTNMSVTIEGLVDLAWRAETELPTTQLDTEMYQKNLDWVFRRKQEWK